MEFWVFTPMYNMSAWIGRTIASLQAQRHGRFRCLIGDDRSSDDSVEAARRAADGDPRFRIVRHDRKLYHLGNVYTIFQLAQPPDEAVVVLLDGDDWLAHDRVFDRLLAHYRDPDCWMTYGSYAGLDGRRDPMCRPYPAWAVRFNAWRQVRWRASHLKTFRAALFRRIPPSYFTVTATEWRAALRRALAHGRFRQWWHWRQIDPAALVSPCGRFVRRCADKAMTYPILELAGRHVRYVDEILYIANFYRKPLDFGPRRVAQHWYTRLTRDMLRHKPRLRPLDGLAPIDRNDQNERKISSLARGRPD